MSLENHDMVALPDLARELGTGVRALNNRLHALYIAGDTSVAYAKTDGVARYQRAAVIAAIQPFLLELRALHVAAVTRAAEERRAASERKAARAAAHAQRPPKAAKPKAAPPATPLTPAAPKHVTPLPPPPPRRGESRAPEVTFYRPSRRGATP